MSTLAGSTATGGLESPALVGNQGAHDATMKAFIFLADAAVVHPDRTFSVLRGGISQVTAPRTQPIVFRGAAVVRVVGRLSEAGSHDIVIRVLNEDGQSIAPDITSTFEVPEGGGAAQIVVSFGFVLPSYGRYSFTVAVDRQEQDTWELRAVPPAPTAGSGAAPE